MVEKLFALLESQGYLKIESNVPFVTLYVQYEISSARVVQVLDCTDDIPITVDQYEVFCQKSKDHIRERGYEDIDFLTLVVTPYVSEAKKFVVADDRCWIIHPLTMAVMIYDNEPDDFYGLRGVIEEGPPAPDIIAADVIAPDVGPEAYYQRQNDSGREFTPVNTALVVLNVIVFFAMTAIGPTDDVEFMLNHGAMYVPAILEKREFYRFFTCIFLHFGFMHLAGNMVVLLFLGDNVERAVGKIKFILIYIFGGLFGSIGSFVYALKYNLGIVSAGASGAIFALIGALLWLVIRNKGRLEDMTTLRMCVLIAYALYNGITSENVDMAAHLFGLFGGFLAAVVLYRKNDRRAAS